MVKLQLGGEKIRDIYTFIRKDPIDIVFFSPNHLKRI
jgi:hypothetical protein